MVEQILSDLGHGDVMNEQLDVDFDALLAEIARYLDAVEAFRSAGREPIWLPESVAATRAGTSRPSSR